MIGVLASAGHDLNHMLDNYTLEQLEIIASGIVKTRAQEWSGSFGAVIRAFAGEGSGSSGAQGGQRAPARKLSPEEEQRQKEQALAKLYQVQGMVARMGRQPKPPSGAERTFRDRLSSIPLPKK